ncbi:cytochrome b/b6 domain-containing protein [Geminocystis sp. NIES-3709]|uniref:cytochrome b/b6 domain-containing protein n=1 Tax=Geminocystis sp. NIES-3709 TaxID=1617448 RepID=UPI0005FCC6B9|nr:cytochrome b/b6 domain-containing protein [Geminocystis sp. NIES-3709]BAQ64800.1 hypothetical protein GM3709_1565 [Geminocystis sp. NIES-3709]
MLEKRSQPYQPLLLRIIHNFQGIFVILAMITAFWTYNTYDGRWGKILWLSDWQEIEGIHGTFGLFAMLILPFFVIYVFHFGNKKLIQSNSISQLKLINKPIWWYSLHRITNTFIIFALTFSVFTGKMMDEKWLPKRELNHFWYYLHLISLIIITLAVGLHLLMSIKIGGYPLLLSMIESQIREKDSWKSYRKKIEDYQKNWLTYIKKEWLTLPTLFQILELIILLIIITAWVISLLK